MLTRTPKDFGYQEAGWTVRVMIDYFSKKGISVKKDSVRRLGCGEGFGMWDPPFNVSKVSDKATLQH